MVIFVGVFAANKIIARMTILFGCHTAVYKKNRPARRSVFFVAHAKFGLKGGDSLDHAVSWFKGGSH